MDQRVAFIAEWLRDEWTMTELAERYQISRKTAYKWVDRYDADPAAGLADRSRAPKAHGRAMAAPLRDAILALRRSASALGAEEAAGDLGGAAPAATRGRPRARWASCCAGRGSVSRGVARDMSCR